MFISVIDSSECLVTAWPRAFLLFLPLVPYSMSRSDPNDANQKTDIFALGSASYFIMKGHPPFPELDSWKDKHEIASRFKARQFSALDNVLGGVVVKKCCAGEYESADEVVHDLEEMTSNLLT
jgi:hypothetical protein